MERRRAFEIRAHPSTPAARRREGEVIRVTCGAASSRSPGRRRAVAAGAIFVPFVSRTRRRTSSRTRAFDPCRTIPEYKSAPSASNQSRAPATPRARPRRDDADGVGRTGGVAAGGGGASRTPGIGRGPLARARDSSATRGAYPQKPRFRETPPAPTTPPSDVRIRSVAGRSVMARRRAGEDRLDPSKTRGAGVAKPRRDDRRGRREGKIGAAKKARGAGVAKPGRDSLRPARRNRRGRGKAAGRGRRSPVVTIERRGRKAGEESGGARAWRPVVTGGIGPRRGEGRRRRRKRRGAGRGDPVPPWRKNKKEP